MGRLDLSDGTTGPPQKMITCFPSIHITANLTSFKVSLELIAPPHQDSTGQDKKPCSPDPPGPASSLKVVVNVQAAIARSVISQPALMSGIGSTTLQPVMKKNPHIYPHVYASVLTPPRGSEFIQLLAKKGEKVRRTDGQTRHCKRNRATAETFPSFSFFLSPRGEKQR